MNKSVIGFQTIKRRTVYFIEKKVKKKKLISIS